MKIVLLNGPATKGFARTGRWQATSRGASLWYPYFLASCCSVLEDAGHQVWLIDAPAYNYSLEKVLLRIKAFEPELCVIDTSTPSIYYDLRTATQIKQCMGRKAPKICMVGPHASALPKETLESGFVDNVIVGEYDYAIRVLAETLFLAEFEKERKESFGFGMTLIEDLDKLPFASRSLFKYLDIRKYNLDFCLHPYMEIMTSRGCPHKCTYCLWPQTLTKGKYRERSLDNVFEEIDYVVKYSIKEIFFDDDTFTANKNRIRRFCLRYRSRWLKYGIPFSANARADVDYKTLEIMKIAGLRCLVVGFESGNQHILDSVKKNITLEQMKDFANICHRLKIQVHGDFMIGLPGETHETIDNTVKFAKQLHLSTFQLSIAVPYPGTEFYRWLDIKNYLTTKDFSKWIDKDGMQRCIINYPHLSNKEIEQAVYDSIKKYYFSWQFFKNALKQIMRHPPELRRYLLGGLRFREYLKGGEND